MTILQGTGGGNRGHERGRARYREQRGGNHEHVLTVSPTKTLRLSLMGGQGRSPVWKENVLSGIPIWASESWDPTAKVFPVLLLSSVPLV